MIQLERHKPPPYKPVAVRMTNVKRALPFVASDAGVYVHRVRSAVVYEVCGKAHMAVSCWCGMTLLVGKRKKGRMLSEPITGRPMCATCEGRAIGAGTTGLRNINGLDVRYEPRRAG